MPASAEQHATDVQSGVLGLLGETRATMVSAMADGARSAAELADLLDISQVAVRRHLARLVDDGWVAGRTDEPDGPGRPATRYVLTTDGHQLLPQGYAALAAELLAYIDETAGADGLADYLDWRARRRVRRLARDVDGDSLDDRLAQLAAALTGIGSTATVAVSGDGFVLRQHHCTVMDVARAHPQLCQAEAEEFARVLGADVEIERGATRALGDRVCECAVVRADPARDADDVDPPDDTTTLPMWQGEPADGTAVPG